VVLYRGGGPRRRLETAEAVICHAPARNAATSGHVGQTRYPCSAPTLIASPRGPIGPSARLGANVPWPHCTGCWLRTVISSPAHPSVSAAVVAPATVQLRRNLCTSPAPAAVARRVHRESCERDRAATIGRTGGSRPRAGGHAHAIRQCSLDQSRRNAIRHPGSWRELASASPIAGGGLTLAASRPDHRAAVASL